MVNGIPIEQELDGEDEELGDGGAVCSDDPSGSADDQASRGAGDMDLSSGEENTASPGAYPPVLGKVCGRLPAGVALQDYLLLPPNTDRRGAEGSYSRSYVARLAAAQLDLRSGFSSSEPLPPDTIISTVAPAEALSKGCRQRELSK